MSEQSRNGQSPSVMQFVSSWARTADLINAVTTWVDVHRLSLIAWTICPAKLTLEQVTRTMGMKRAARGRDVLVLGQLSGCKSGDLSD